MNKQVFVYFILINCILIHSQCFAHILTEKPDVVRNERVIRDRLEKAGFIEISKEAALEKLKIHNVFFEDSSNIETLSAEDVNSVLAAISILPENLSVMFPRVIVSIDLNALLGIAYYDFTINFTELNYGKISLTKHWSAQSFERKVGTILHELGHHFNYVFGDFHYSDFWKNIDGGWETKELSPSPKFPKHYVSVYAESNPAEDWAESFTLYVLDKDRLQKISPNKFNFLDRLLTEHWEEKELLKFKRKLGKPYRASHKKMKGISLYIDCLNLTKNLSKNFCSTISLIMLNSGTIKNSVDLSSSNESAFIFSLHLKALNEFIKH